MEVWVYNLSTPHTSYLEKPSCRTHVYVCPCICLVRRTWQSGQQQIYHLLQHTTITPSKDETLALLSLSITVCTAYIPTMGIF